MLVLRFAFQLHSSSTTKDLLVSSLSRLPTTSSVKQLRSDIAASNRCLNHTFSWPPSFPCFACHGFDRMGEGTVSTDFTFHLTMSLRSIKHLLTRVQFVQIEKVKHWEARKFPNFSSTPPWTQQITGKRKAHTTWSVVKEK